ncbi:hypothetical protein I350_03162 [Cryptococcus amylolentus CBS 6273]|uniref:BTB domain-containing protein n=1 Tax=Cryptococcus amylolentus CBS 6273 TaxID=1296118 RepID=A0A1E3K8X8_9TREE|nr:hypothetical protein I350_03162 [Cryptococcus amylolentus CBS 6273]
MSNPPPVSAENPSIGNKHPLPLEHERDPKNRKIEVTAHESWNDTSNEIRLVSTDGIAFFVPKYLLQAGSTVFRDMFSVTQGAPAQSHSSSTTKVTHHHTIEMTDDYFEGSDTILLFLDAVRGLPLSSQAQIRSKLDGEIVHALECLLQFAKKWDSDLTLAAYEMVLLHEATDCYWKDSQLTPIDIFALAALGGFSDVAAMVVRLYRPIKATDGSCSYERIDGRWGVLDPEDMFYPSNMSKEAWQTIPVEYMYALEMSEKLFEPIRCKILASKGCSDLCWKDPGCACGRLRDEEGELRAFLFEDELLDVDSENHSLPAPAKKLAAGIYTYSCWWPVLRCEVAQEPGLGSIQPAS